MKTTESNPKRGPRGPRGPLVRIDFPQPKVSQKFSLAKDKIQLLKDYQEYLCQHYKMDAEHITVDVVLEGLIETLTREKPFIAWREQRSN